MMLQAASLRDTLANSNKKRGVTVFRPPLFLCWESDTQLLSYVLGNCVLVDHEVHEFGKDEVL